MYPVDITVRDLEGALTGHVAKHGFQSVSFDLVHPLDQEYFGRRDRRESTSAIGLPPAQQWRPSNDFLVYDTPAGTVAYVRPNPLAPLMYHTLPVELHLRTAAPRGYTVQQYFSLALPQRNMRMVLEALRLREASSVSAIADMDEISVLRRIPHEIDMVDTLQEDTVREGDALPVHLFHSVYISRKREENGGRSNHPAAVAELSRAMSTVIIAAHIFSRKQIAYYGAAAHVDQLFSDSALVE